jgi:hypothetical protein
MSEDFSEFYKLEQDLGEAPKDSGPFMRVALHKTSEKIRDAWKGKLDGSEYLPHLGRAISWDISTFQGFGVSVMESEIGFDKGRKQGPLGNISEFGTPRTPPRGYGAAALQENEGDLEHGLEQAVDDALRKSGL